MLAPNTQEKLRYLLGDQKAGHLLTSLDQEANIAAKNKEVVGGSPTGEKVQRSRLTQPPETGGISGFLNNLNAMRPGTWLSTGEDAYRNSRYQDVRSELAPFLTRPIGPNGALIQQLLSGAQQQGANAQTALGVRNLATALINAGEGAKRLGGACPPTISGPPFSCARGHLPERKQGAFYTETLLLGFFHDYAKRKDADE